MIGLAAMLQAGAAVYRADRVVDMRPDPQQGTIAPAAGNVVLREELNAPESWSYS
jgi:hypothetical protein